jgi:hypothetical protein
MAAARPANSDFPMTEFKLNPRNLNRLGVRLRRRPGRLPGGHTAGQAGPGPAQRRQPQSCPFKSELRSPARIIESCPPTRRQSPSRPGSQVALTCPPQSSIPRSFMIPNINSSQGPSSFYPGRFTSHVSGSVARRAARRARATVPGKPVSTA